MGGKMQLVNQTRAQTVGFLLFGANLNLKENFFCLQSYSVLEFPRIERKSVLVQEYLIA